MEGALSLFLGGGAGGMGRSLERAVSLMGQLGVRDVIS